jgi:hypothetical protein
MCVYKNHAFIYFMRPPPWYGTRGLIYTNYVPRKNTVYANSIVEALSFFSIRSDQRLRPEGDLSIVIILRSTQTPWWRSGWQPRTSGSLNTLPGPRSRGLFPVDNHQNAAGGQDPDPGELQSHVGGDLQDYRWRGLCHRLLAMVLPVWEVCSFRQWLRREILLKKRWKIFYP